MKWRFSQLILAASLFLSILALALWLTSIFRSDLMFFQRLQQGSVPTLFNRHNEFWISSDRGTLSFGVGVWNDHVPHGNSAWSRVWVKKRDPSVHNMMALSATWRGSPLSTMWISTVYLPYPLVMLVLLLPWIARYWRLRNARRRVAMNLCRACGYDLRASPERCPECGEVVIHQ